eukprot:XP_001707793.1 Hypothetical protein GL50803_38548 [Giardia lamblia ATCC 50803]
MCNLLVPFRDSNHKSSHAVGHLHPRFIFHKKLCHLNRINLCCYHKGCTTRNRSSFSIIISRFQQVCAWGCHALFKVQ